ncbi:hypothetical protein [Streptomyces clavuligerus]|nr:hypothetical protein [Streptomyces clavuligerus]
MQGVLMIKARLKASVAALAATVLFTGLSAGEAMAVPNSTKTFSLSGTYQGHTGYTEGYLYFYNRSVGITGTVKSNTTGCVQVVIAVHAGGRETDHQTRTACGRGTGTSTGFNYTASADIPGGADEVEINLAGLDGRGQIDAVITGGRYRP